MKKQKSGSLGKLIDCFLGRPAEFKADSRRFLWSSPHKVVVRGITKEKRSYLCPTISRTETLRDDAWGRNVACGAIGNGKFNGAYQVHKNFYFTGFTLIELLVVVLIIGILVAVAVPQYQKVVDKAQIVQIQTFMNSVIKAQEVYYLANGYYAYRFDDLDIEIRRPCSFGGVHDILNCKIGVLDIRNTDKQAEGAALIFRFCPTVSNPTYNTCTSNTMFETIYRFPHATGPSGQRNDSWACNVFADRANPIKKIFCP